MDARDSNLIGSASPPEVDWVRRTEFVTSASTAQLKQGKTFVIAGSAVCILGIAIYCLSLVSNDFGQQETIFLKTGLVVIGTGFICWLLGAIKYLNAAIDSNSSEEIF